MLLEKKQNKTKTNPRGDRGLALAQSPGNGNSNSVYIFFPISLLLRFPWRSGADPFPPLRGGTFGSFQHSCTGNPMSLETNLSSPQMFVCPSVCTQRPSGQHPGLSGSLASRAVIPCDSLTMSGAQPERANERYRCCVPREFTCRGFTPLFSADVPAASTDTARSGCPTAVPRR